MMLRTGDCLKIWILMVIPVLFSCTEVLDKKIPQMEPKIVLHGYLNPEKPVKVYLHQSAPRLSDIDSLKAIKDADVKIYENDQLFCLLQYTDSVDKSLGAIYKKTTHYPESGNQYRVIVDAPGLEKIEASTTIPEKTNMHSITTKKGTKVLYNETHNVTLCQITLKNNLQDDGYYAFRLNRGNFGSMGRINRYGLIVEYPHFFSDNMVNENKYEFLIDIDWIDYQRQDTLKAVSELYTITRDHYLYHESILSYLEKDHLPYLEDTYLPITEPEQLYSNVENGLGIFAGVNVARDSVCMVIYGKVEER